MVYGVILFTPVLGEFAYAPLGAFDSFASAQAAAEYTFGHNVAGVFLVV